MTRQRNQYFLDGGISAKQGAYDTTPEQDRAASIRMAAAAIRAGRQDELLTVLEALGVERQGVKT